MPSLVIKNLPKNVHDSLKARAKVNRRSITQEAIFSLEQIFLSDEPTEFPRRFKPLKPISPELTGKIIRKGRKANP